MAQFSLQFLITWTLHRSGQILILGLLCLYNYLLMETSTKQNMSHSVLTRSKQLLRVLDHWWIRLFCHPAAVLVQLPLGHVTAWFYGSWSVCHYIFLSCDRILSPSLVRCLRPSRPVGRETAVQLAQYFVYKNSNGTGHEKKAEELGCFLQTLTISPNLLYQFYQGSKMVHPLLLSLLFADILLLINLLNIISNLLVLSTKIAVSQKFIAHFAKEYFLFYV